MRVGLVLLGCLVLATSAVAAPEAWCTANPSNCVCHRSLEANSWVADGGGFFHEANQDTTDTKLCTLSRNAQNFAQIWLQGGSPTVVTGLNGHTGVQNDGTMVVEPTAAMRTSVAGKRVGVRYYHFWSSDYVSTSSVDPVNLCNNDKYTEIGDYFTAYDNRFTESNDGASMPGGISPTTMRGKWARIEHYIQVYGTGATTHEYYVTDLATNTTYSLTAPARLSLVQSNLDGETHPLHKYRAGPCAGNYIVQYVIMASWPAGGGQRIGVATELETAGSAPTAPSGLTVRQP